MDFREKKLTIKEAKEIYMVFYLSKIGYEPTKVRGDSYWYLSPLHEEKTPSFKVSQKLNRWFDHGIGKGGNLVDFGVLYWSCSVAGVLVKLSGNFSLQQQPILPVRPASEPESKIKILGNFLLSSYPLQRYLQQRQIPFEIATRFCRELRYELDGKKYYGIGFKNNFGGYEIRNIYHKLSSSPKGITALLNGADTVLVFEGFFDFLSFMVIRQNSDFKSADYIVLNSLAFLESTRPLLDTYKNVYLFLDNDIAGKSASTLALSWGKQYHDESGLYNGYEDLNDWLVNTAAIVDGCHLQILASSFSHEKPPNPL